LLLVAAPRLIGLWYEWQSLALTDGVDEGGRGLDVTCYRGQEWDLSGGGMEMKSGTVIWTLRRYVDPMTIGVIVSRELIEKLRLWFTDEEIVDQTAVTASYNSILR